MEINEQIDDALGIMARSLAQMQPPSKNQYMTNLLRGQQPPGSFAEGVGMPLQQPTVSVPQQQPRPSPAMPQPQMQPQAQSPGPAFRPNPVPGVPQQPMGIQPPQMKPPQQQPPSDPLLQQYAGLDKQEGDLTSQIAKLNEPPDRSKAEAAYREHVAQGDQAMLMALAAQQAGPQFAPMQQMFLKQHAAAQEPMKVAGGTYTPSGFIEDVDATANRKLQALNQQLAHIQQAKNSNITEQSRQQLKREEDKIRQEMQQLTLGVQTAIAQAASADRRYQADLAHTDRQAALDAKGGGPGKILPAKTVSDLTEGQNKAQTIGRLAGDFKPEFAGMEGTAMTYAGKLPFVDTKASEWWRNYRKEAELIERHGLFGAALTPTESQSWREADISPGMAPDAIERNLKRRNEILQQHQDNYVRNYRASGYNTEAFPVPEAQLGGAAGTWGAPPPPTGQAGPLKKARAAAAASAAGGASGSAPKSVSWGSL